MTSNVNADALARTPFEQLPADAQNELVKLEQIIQKQAHICEEISQHSYHAIDKIRDKVKSINDVLDGIKEAIAEDSKRVQEFYQNVSRQLKEADKQLRTSARCGTNSHQPPVEIPSPFFWSLLAEFETRMQTYKHQIEDIESALRTPSTVPGDVSVIGEIVSANNETFLSVASKVAELHKRLQNIKREIVKALGEDPFKYRKSSNASGTPKTEEILYPPIPVNALKQPSATATPSFSTGFSSSGTTGGLFGQSQGSSNFGNTSSTSSMFGTPLASVKKSATGSMALRKST